MAEKKIHSILIADDDDFLRGLLVDVFTKSGFSVIEARDGLEALKATTQYRPEAILTGIMMPNMDGFTFVEQVKSTADLYNTPVFILSHLGREEDKQRAESLGVNGFLIKGLVPPKEIVELVAAAVRTQVFLLKIDLESYDGVRFAQINGLTGGFALEVAMDADQQGEKIFKAKIVPEVSYERIDEEAETN